MTLGQRGSIVAKDDLASLEGTVTEARGGGTYVIKLETGHVVTAKLGGAMRRFKIRVIVGDRVTVGVSPYDPSHGLIRYRHKT
jgi:translation initiation factor IF-1